VSDTTMLIVVLKFVQKNYKKKRHKPLLILYPGTELNRHEHYCPQDFKSCVSTSSTTRVSKKNPASLTAKTGNYRAEDRARTGHLDLGKVALYQMSYFRNYIKNCLFFRIAKIRFVSTAKNFIYTLDYTMYYPELPH
jgi:hypothetical protein